MVQCDAPPSAPLGLVGAAGFSDVDAPPVAGVVTLSEVLVPVVVDVGPVVVGVLAVVFVVVPSGRLRL